MKEQKKSSSLSPSEKKRLLIAMFIAIVCLAWVLGFLAGNNYGTKQEVKRAELLEAAGHDHE